MQKILITGSAGFLLSNFIRHCSYNKAPYKISSIDKFVSKSSINNLYFNKNYSFHIGDITDDHFIDTVFSLEKPDIVINGAEDQNSLNTNIYGVKILSEACIKHGSKLIQLSTDKVYGSLDSSEDESWDESSLLNPKSIFAISKASAEMIVKSYANSDELKYNIIRLGNIFGPRQNSQKLVYEIINGCINNRPIVLHGDGMQTRDWSYSHDVCSGINFIINNGKNNEIYNLSSGHEYSSLEMANKICNIMELPHHTIKFDNKKIDYRRSINCEKIKSLGWKSEFKFSEGLKNTISWYNANRWFCK